MIKNKLIETIKSDKDLKKIRDKNSISVRLRLSCQEKILLEKMMKDDDWTNTSGFIKYRLFGLDSKSLYRKKTDSPDEEDMKIIFRNLLEDFNRNMIYCSCRFEKETSQIHKTLHRFGVLDKRTTYRWFEILISYAKDFRGQAEILLSTYHRLLKFMGVVAYEKTRQLSSPEKEEYLRNIPDEVLDTYMRENWQDTMSDLVKEQTRRIEEMKKRKSE